MLSICGGIYMNGNIVPFVRSVLDKAGNPDEIEFVVAEDEAPSDLMDRAFDQLFSMTKRLTVIKVLKTERLSYFGRCLNFYERERVFPQNRVDEFRERLALYASGKMPRLWFHPAWLHNRAVAASTGDVVLVTPLDLLTTFDLSESYRAFKAVLAQRKNFCVLFGLREGNRVRQHGIKMFNKGLFDLLKQEDRNFSTEKFAFDERWFSPSFGEDDWNERAAAIGGVSRGWEEVFGEPRLFLMPDSPWFPEYICKNMNIDHPYFLTCMHEYLKRGAK